jgi:multicomponent K+:H+ antiporter subunit A
MPLPLTVLVLFLGAALPMVVARWSRRGASFAAAAPLMIALASVLGSYRAVAAGAVVKSKVAWVPALGLDLALRLDGLSMLFAVLVLGIGLLVILYAAYYLSPRDPAGRFFALLLVFVGAMTGLVLSDNILVLVVFWELTSVSSFLLIGYYREQEAARRGARMALLVTGAGGLGLLGGVLLLGSIVGSFDLDVVLGARDKIHGHPLYLPALLLILFGAFTKSAQVPFHFWLPEAMAAPTPVSAYLHSATMVKAGVFLLARLHPALAGTEIYVVLVAGAGLTTLVFGAFAALHQDDLKGLLAYSTISHLGLIVLLLGFDSPKASIAAVFHILNHATFKASLFMAAGIVDHETGTRDMRRLSGLFRHMPRTGALAIISCSAMAGVPLLNGFLSKEMFFAEVVEADIPVVGGAAITTLAALAGLFGVTYSLRFVHSVFFRGDAARCPRAPHEPPSWMRIPVELLALFCLVVGLFPAVVDRPFVAMAARAVVGAPLPEYDIAHWHGFTIPLLMTIVAFVGGVILYAILPKLIALHRRVVPEAPMRRLYARLERLTVRSAEGFTAGIDDGSLQRYAALLVAAAVVACTPALLGVITGPVAWHRPDAASVLLWAAAIVATFGVAIVHHRRFVALVFLSAVGSIVALAFVRLEAPDLALTQLLVEIVSILLMLLALHQLPQRPPREVPRLRRVAHAALAAACGLAAGVLAWAVLTRPEPPDGLREYFLANSVPEGGGTNVVNVVLVDFRGFDTLGEVAVLGIAAVGVSVMLEGVDPSRRTGSAAPRAGDRSPLILVTVSRALLPLALVVSAFLFFRGHNLPGGGFIAALLTTIALVLQYLASGVAWTHERLRRDFLALVAGGVLVATATGLSALAFGKPLLTMTFTHLHLAVLGEIEVATALLFDLGIYLGVVGATVLLLARLGKLTRAAGPDTFIEEVDPWKP